VRLAAFDAAGTARMGVVEGGTIRPLCAVDEFYAAVDEWLGRAAALDTEAVALADVTAVPPVPVTARVLCVGLNYRSHAEEASQDLSAVPNVFARWASTLVAPGTPVAVPPREDGLDWEGELAVVVGRRLLDGSPDDAHAATLGYTCFNDLSARTFQMAASQWALGKNADRSGPIGPEIVTRDELTDVGSLLLETRVNDEVVQSAKTDQMIFPPDDVLAYASGCLTLEPGDVLATGTPEGVGFLRTPPRLLGPGDVVEVAIESIGTLRNPIVARADLAPQATS
jgi:2-keto-4-pentenoate hydratase/2-oxohepta-3-ene-1,7-dioic acid hydratase in catechol pathway